MGGRMKIKKDEVVIVNHSRSGKWLGKATEDFDTDMDGFYPIVLDSEMARGMSKVWYKGDDMPARKELCKISRQ